MMPGERSLHPRGDELLQECSIPTDGVFFVFREQLFVSYNPPRAHQTADQSRGQAGTDAPVRTFKAGRERHDESRFVKAPELVIDGASVTGTQESEHPYTRSWGDNVRPYALLPWWLLQSLNEADRAVRKESS